MSVRIRKWTTAKGEAREKYVVNYTDQSGKRRMKTFERKKEADAYRDRVRVDVREGVHTPDSSSVTVAQAAAKWLDTCRANNLERSTLESYEDNARHLMPFIGAVKLSKLNVPTIRALEDRLVAEERSRAMTKKILSSLSSIVGDAQERGLVARNVCLDLRSRRTNRAKGERRVKGHLKVGVEISAFLRALQGRWRPILLTAVFTGLRRQSCAVCGGPTSTSQRASFMSGNGRIVIVRSAGRSPRLASGRCRSRTRYANGRSHVRRASLYFPRRAVRSSGCPISSSGA
jgi:integrase